MLLVDDLAAGGTKNLRHTPCGLVTLVNTPCILDNFACFFVLCRFFTKSTFSKNFIQEYLQECQTVWIQIRPDILSGLIWVQTVCKGYLQTKPVSRVNWLHCMDFCIDRKSINMDLIEVTGFVQA